MDLISPLEYPMVMALQLFSFNKMSVNVLEYGFDFTLCVYQGDVANEIYFWKSDSKSLYNEVIVEFSLCHASGYWHDEGSNIETAIGQNRCRSLIPVFFSKPNDGNQVLTLFSYKNNFMKDFTQQ